MNQHTLGDSTDTEIRQSEEDRFGFQDYALVLADQAAGAGTPLTIGIFGRWGSGKTSLMHLVREELKREDEHRRGAEGDADGGSIQTLWINVWQLSNQEQVWHAFLQSLLTRVHEELPWRRRLSFDWGLFWQRVTWRSLLRGLVANAYRVAIAVTPIVVALLWPGQDAGDSNLARDLVAGGGLSLILGLALLVSPAVEAVRQKASLDLSTMFEEAPYEAQVSALGQLQGQFERMVKAWVGDQGRLVVFIDDLDRCTPDKVPEVLEAIKLFTTTPRCVYVLGLDHDIVREGIKTRYEFETDLAADEYLEKIVQIPFHLPPLDEMRIESFVREYYPDLGEEHPTAPDVFSKGLEPNPRKVKRALNVYRTLLALAEVRLKAWEMDPVEPELVAKMVVIESRFRPLHRHLVVEPEFLLELDNCLPEPEAGAALKDDALIQALEKDGEVCKVLIGEEAADESDARPGLVDPEGLGALVAMLLAGKRRFKHQSLDQIRSYIYLIATSEGGAGHMRPSRRERERLLGGDREQIRAQVREILTKSVDEQAQQRITGDYLDRLQGVLDDSDRYTEDERKSGKIALRLLKSPVPETVRVPEGPFTMGTSPEEVDHWLAGAPEAKREWFEAELPQHTVHLPEYAIAKYPVTNAEYQVFVLHTRHRPPEGWDGEDYGEGQEDHPVVNVTWHDATAYCRWLAQVTGKPYRLPSEAEWEKAARGTDGRLYPWGDEPPDETRCNFGEVNRGITSVGRYSPGGDSPFGCVDMAGNVWEWTLSLWGKGPEEPDFKYPYKPEDGREDVEAGDDICRVLRGGAFDVDLRVVRCASRDGYYPDLRNADYGFRLVLAPGL